MLAQRTDEDTLVLRIGRYASVRIKQTNFYAMVDEVKRDTRRWKRNEIENNLHMVRRIYTSSSQGSRAAGGRWGMALLKDKELASQNFQLFT